MLIEIFLLLVGFGLLIKGADFFVEASVGIAEKLKVPGTIIGLTIVALGTSAPEAVISITASLGGSNALSVGNVVGSNLFNLLVVVGVCAVVKPFFVELREISLQFWISIIATVVFLLAMILSAEYIPGGINLGLFLAFLGYIILLIWQAINNRTDEVETVETAEKVGKTQRALDINALIAVVACVAIVGGGQITVNSAVNIAHAIGMSERVVGLTIVAIGTSLPELITSLVAIKKGEDGMALGNVVGSNIFNLLGILGIVGLISPLAVNNELIMDLGVLLGTCAIMLLFFYVGRRVSRLNGVILLTGYVVYSGVILFG
ncbi:MAG: calcium/sodium antiporter [Turicibacter sp.]|nr:calcium/sodium antiporter [Turicibacter sp.]